MANFVRLFVTGNPNWLVPAGFEERRFAVLDCGEDHTRDIPYFTAIDKEMNDGGREALLDHLLKFDLTTVDLRTIPKTLALLEQKLSSLDPEKGWWLDVLQRGELPSSWGCDEPNIRVAADLLDDYIKHANKQGARRKAIETVIGMFLNKHVPGLYKKDALVGTNPNFLTRKLVYVFPPLADCRAAFTKMIGQDFVWFGREEWGQDIAEPEEM